MFLGVTERATKFSRPVGALASLPDCAQGGRRFQLSGRHSFEDCTLKIAAASGTIVVNVAAAVGADRSAWLRELRAPNYLLRRAAINLMLPAAGLD